MRLIPLELRLTRGMNFKESGGDWEYKYDDRVSLHADDDSKQAGNLIF